MTRQASERMISVPNLVIVGSTPTGFCGHRQAWFLNGERHGRNLSLAEFLLIPGPRTTCYNRFVRWRRAGVWDQIMDALAAGHDAAVQMIDTAVVRMHQHGACVADNNHQDMGRSRGGLTSKIHAVVDTNGLPVHLALTPGEAHDNRLCSVLLSALLPQTMLLADRGYDADWIRELARQQGAWANIPPKRNRKDPICFSPYLYRVRNLIERFFNKIKQCRRVATRYDKLAANYLAFVKLASIRVWLRANESTP